MLHSAQTITCNHSQCQAYFDRPMECHACGQYLYAIAMLRIALEALLYDVDVSSLSAML